MRIGCILLVVMPLVGTWVALFLRARCRDRLIERAEPIMTQGEHREQWLRRSPATDWLWAPFRKIHLLKSAPLPPELQRMLRRFTVLTYASWVLIALVITVALTAHRIC